MKLLNQTVKEAFGRALQAAFPSLSDLTPIVATSKYGDFQCNSALALWKKHGKELGLSSAKETADRVAEHLRKDAASLFSSVQVSPQGFITADVAAGWLQDDLVAFLEQQQQPLPPLREEEKRKVIVDFSSPNVAKEMHVGHLRSTIIGESICRILEFRGHAVERVNHVGDWGTQFGMLIEYLHSEFPNYKDSMPDISDLNAFYKRAKAKFDADEGFKRRSRDMVVKLQGGDPAALESWRLICEISRKEFDKVYRRLGVQLEERGESTYNDVIPSVVRELTEKGMVSESDGAKCVFTSAGEVPLLLVKSDGGYGYDTTDLAAVRDRLVKRGADWVIYVTDLGQEDHFMKVFAAAAAAGWHQQPRTRLDHVGFGVVQGQDGKRFKTRSGETVKLVDLLDEATARALKELLRRKAEDAAAAAEDGKAEGTAQQGEAEGGREGAAGAAARNNGEEHRGGSSRVAGGVRGPAAAGANSGRPEEESANAPPAPAAPAAEEKRQGAAAAATKASAATLSDARGKQRENGKREDGEAQQESLKERSDACVKNGLNETGTAVEGEATEEMRQAAEAIGYSAVKYFDLKQNRHTDYKFSYDRMLDPKGNTAVYMLYAYARICAIFRKAGIDPQLLDPKKLQLVEPEERKLALLLAQFPDIVYAILDDLHIHRLAEYMYKVAGAFTEFYQTCKVLGVPQESSRLLLSECTRRILQTCFHLLGITPLQRL